MWLHLRQNTFCLFIITVTMAQCTIKTCQTNGIRPVNQIQPIFICLPCPVKLCLHCLLISSSSSIISHPLLLRRGRLIEATPKVLSTPLSVIHMFAINSTAPKGPKLYICPIYKKPRRTDLIYITGVVMQTVQSPDHWILRGVALLCDIK